MPEMQPAWRVERRPAGAGKHWARFPMTELRRQTGG
jgi:hypothetical protein